MRVSGMSGSFRKVPLIEIRRFSFVKSDTRTNWVDLDATGSDEMCRVVARRDVLLDIRR